MIVPTEREICHKDKLSYLSQTGVSGVTVEIVRNHETKVRSHGAKSIDPRAEIVVRQHFRTHRSRDRRLDDTLPTALSTRNGVSLIHQLNTRELARDETGWTTSERAEGNATQPYSLALRATLN